MRFEIKKKVPKRILIVDDDVLSLKLAGLILGQNGFDVFKAKSGIDAISFLKRQDVDLILLDIEMPMMNGLKTLEKLRKDSATAKIPVICVTSNADSETVVNACRLEIVDYIRKPFKPEDLLARVKRVF
jgi:DNA-binding response OmpR family regulator